MVPINDIDLATLPDAVIAWTGYGSSAYPFRDDATVRQAYPPQVASRLILTIRTLEGACYHSDAHLTAANLPEIGKAASPEFMPRHPSLPEVIADALAWCYTLDYK